MKRIVLALAMAVASLVASAQNQPVGMRMEVVEATDNDARYSLFTYVDADGTYGYYLSLGHEVGSLSVGGSFGTLSVGRYDETCLWLGATRDEAFAMLDTIIALYDREPGTVIDMAARLSDGTETMGQDITVACEVHKKFLGGKRLWFYFPSGRRTGEVFLNKSTAKQLRWALKADKKLHPKRK